MKFGHVATEELDQLDLSLPQDHPDTAEILKSGSPDPCEVITGCAKWGIPAWVESVYPEGTKQKEFLARYHEIFGGVELNNTFYRLSRSAIADWAETVKASGFRFSPKWSRRVSHIKRLKQDCLENIEYFMTSCEGFGEHLGATFLQMPENFAPKYAERLDWFRQQIPDGFPVQVELRHQDWVSGEAFDSTFQSLRKNGLGAVIMDTAGRRDLLHMRLTTDTAFVRFVGYDLHQSDYDRLDAWVERIVAWSDAGLKSIYFYCHQDDESLTPKLCAAFLEKLNATGKWNLPIPEVGN